jgi:hypothetical protein
MNTCGEIPDVPEIFAYPAALYAVNILPPRRHGRGRFNQVLTTCDHGKGNG